MYSAPELAKLQAAEMRKRQLLAEIELERMTSAEMMPVRATDMPTGRQLINNPQ
jgi:hypothetical protein